MNITAARKLKHGSKVSVMGRGNGHEPDAVINLTVVGDIYSHSNTQQSINKISYVWVYTNIGVWPSHRLF